MTSISHPSDDHPRSQKSLLASTWQVLDQVCSFLLLFPRPPSHFFSKPPPPTLREILGAYRSRGDGDREMLMAMLNAKSAEDQVSNVHDMLLQPCIHLLLYRG